MKIVVVGTRGIPDILGGVETHCQELYPRMEKMGHDVTIIRRTPYLTDNNRDMTSFQGVKLVDVYAPHKKSFEAIVHTFLAVLKARKLKADIVHIHSIGPNILAPFARLLGLKVVMTHHGPDYDRQKWGFLAKNMLKFGEWCGAKFCNHIIVISDVIRQLLVRKYGTKNQSLVFNGISLPVKSKRTDYIESLGLEPGKYVVSIGRFVKEKRFDDLINAFVKCGLSGYKLALAGDADHADEYSESLKALARKNGVVLTGFIKGEKLNQLMTNAALFVIPSSHEGLPFALLEAMSYDLDVISSDIPANKLECLSEDDFYPMGDVGALSQLIKRRLDNDEVIHRSYDLSAYDWDSIAKKTAEIYQDILNR